MNPKAISVEVIRFFLTLTFNNSIIDPILSVFGTNWNKYKFNCTNTTHACIYEKSVFQNELGTYQIENNIMTKTS